MSNGCNCVEQLKSILCEYIDFGLDISVDELIDSFEGYPDLLSAFSEMLEECLSQKAVIENRRIGRKNNVVFEIEASYDKRYFCAAKLADSAKSVRYNSDRDVFVVTFSGVDVEKIALMYYNLNGWFNSGDLDLIIAFDFLRKHYFISYIEEILNSFVNKNRMRYGSLLHIFEFAFDSFHNAISNYHKRKLTEVYKSICAEGRVPTKWSGEYKFYLLVKRFIPDVVFQYTCSWLGKQSFDVFSPSLNLALEYQGQQHYVAVDFFGGSDGLHDNQMRDDTKRRLANEHNVLLLEWKYSYHMSRFTVLKFLQKNGIALECEWDGKMPDDREMAPVVFNSLK